MFDKLGQIKDLWKLRSQMEEIKKRLETMVVKAEGPHHWVEVTVNGTMVVTEVKLSESAKDAAPAELAEEIKLTVNKAIRDSQALAAQAMGGFGGMPQA